MTNVKAAVAATLLLAACGSDPKPPEPEGPQVRLRSTPREVIGGKLPVTVEISGCETGVQRVVIRDRETTLGERAQPTALATFELQTSAIDFKARGVAADLSLKAEVTCMDGKTATSEAVPVTVLPAEQTIAGPWDLEHNFWVDPSGTAVLGCKASGNSFGRFTLDKNPYGSIPLPWACTAYAELAFAGTNRVLLEPGVGLAGFSDQMASNFARSEIVASQMTVQQVSTGTWAVVTYEPGNLAGSYLRAYRADTAAKLWELTAPSIVAGRLGASPNGYVLVPYSLTGSSTSQATLRVARYRLSDGAAAPVPTLKIVDVTVSGALEIAEAPRMSFDPAGTTGYYARPGNPPVATACNVAGDQDCAWGSGMRWEKALEGITEVVATPNAVIAWGPRIAYLLDPATGRQLGSPVTPTGSLAFSGVLANGGANLLFAQASNQAGVHEIFLFDQPDKAPAMHFYSPGGGYIVDLDKQGRTWLWGQSDISRLFSATQYRSMVQ